MHSVQNRSRFRYDNEDIHLAVFFSLHSVTRQRKLIRTPSLSPGVLVLKFINSLVIIALLTSPFSSHTCPRYLRILYTSTTTLLGFVGTNSSYVVRKNAGLDQV